MGWIVRRDLDGYASPQSFMDAKCSGETEEGVATLLHSVMVAGKTYFAALHEHWRDKGTMRVVILRADIRFEPRRTDGEIFGYKIWPDLIDPDDPQCPVAIRVAVTQLPLI
jgi:hypothetical protein